MTTQGATAIVIPTFNERETIGTTLETVHGVVPDARILVVDDSSPDGTAEAVMRVQQAVPGVDILSRREREGLGPAYMAGFRKVLEEGATQVLQMDADGSHRPEDIPGLLDAVATGAGVALGSRYVPGGGSRDWGLLRRVLSRGGSAYAACILGLGVHDATGGFRCWDAPLLRQLIQVPLELRQFGFQLEMLHRARLVGAKIVEVPILFPDRQAGQSKMRIGIALEALAGVWRLRFRTAAIRAAIQAAAGGPGRT